MGHPGPPGEAHGDRPGGGLEARVERCGLGPHVKMIRCGLGLCHCLCDGLKTRGTGVARQLTMYFTQENLVHLKALMLVMYEYQLPERHDGVHGGCWWG